MTRHWRPWQHWQQSQHWQICRGDVARRPRAAVLAVALTIACGAGPGAARADQQTGTSSATASLEFVLNIGKFIFFRIGDAAFPTASSTVATVAFTASPLIPTGGVAPVNGGAAGVAWSAGAPTFAVAGTGAALPVEVRSNAGAISLRASVISPLASGGNTIPLSQITVASSDANLPAPPVPNAGVGSAVSVNGTSFSNLVTQRTATWTFSYTPVGSPPAGQYTGQIGFTASSP